MHDELVKELREVFPNINCDGCPVNRMCWGLKGTCVFEKAADVIEELSKALDTANEANTALYGALPKWISVKEQLPDYPCRFMCYYEVDDYGEVGHCIDWGRYDPDDGWYTSGVTHWQKVPEPPEEET